MVQGKAGLQSQSSSAKLHSSLGYLSSLTSCPWWWHLKVGCRECGFCEDAEETVAALRSLPEGQCWRQTSFVHQVMFSERSLDKTCSAVQCELSCRTRLVVGGAAPLRCSANWLNTFSSSGYGPACLLGAKAVSGAARFPPRPPQRVLVGVSIRSETPSPLNENSLGGPVHLLQWQLHPGYC